MITTRSAHNECVGGAAPIPFPVERAKLITSSRSKPDASRDSTEDVLDALATVSRRITDLARELGCLGYFDDANDDRPRAA